MKELLQTPEWEFFGLEPEETQGHHRHPRQVIQVKMRGFPEANLILPSGREDDIEVMSIKDTSLVCVVTTSRTLSYVGLNVFDINPANPPTEVQAVQEGGTTNNYLLDAEVPDYQVFYTQEQAERALGPYWDDLDLPDLTFALLGGEVPTVMTSGKQRWISS